jgi:hypothetical protein
MSPFKELLTEFVKQAASGDELPGRLFRDGDATHLKRWLSDDRADEIYEKINSNKQFHFNRAFDFIMITLRLRHLAEESDALNRKVATLERGGKKAGQKERKRAARMLANSEMSLDEFAAISASVKEHEHPAKFVDLPRDLSVRSDEKGSRKRTLFCRLLSKSVHRQTGQWHDAEVATMCEIAFGGDSVTLDTVRSARRESTRKKRR